MTHDLIAGRAWGDWLRVNSPFDEQRGGSQDAGKRDAAEDRTAADLAHLSSATRNEPAMPPKRPRPSLQETPVARS